MQTDRSRDIAITRGRDKITKDEINPVAKREKERVMVVVVVVVVKNTNG